MKTLAEYFNEDGSVDPIPSDRDYYLLGRVPVRVNMVTKKGYLVDLVGISESGMPFNVTARANHVYFGRLDEYV